MDPYKILGIETDATPEEIRRAYRRQAKKYHPDAGGDVWVFQQVQDAYDELTGKKKKKRRKKPSQQPGEPADSPKPDSAQASSTQSAEPDGATAALLFTTAHSRIDKLPA